jgi:hypothetical protein
MRSALAFGVILLFFSATLLAAQEDVHVYHLAPSGHPIIRHITLLLERAVESPPELVSHDRRPSQTPEPSMPVVLYFAIDSDVKILELEVEFVVSKEWFKQNRALENEVLLLELGEEWIEHPAELVDNDETYFYYRAEGPSAPVLAIAARALQSQQVLLPVVAVMVVVSAISMVYWFLIRPRKPFIPLRKLKREKGAPVMIEKEGIAPKTGVRAEDLEALRKLRRKIRGRKGGG